MSSRIAWAHAAPDFFAGDKCAEAVDPVNQARAGRRKMDMSSAAVFGKLAILVLDRLVNTRILSNQDRGSAVISPTPVVHLP